MKSKTADCDFKFCFLTLTVTNSVAIPAHGFVRQRVGSLLVKRNIADAPPPPPQSVVRKRSWCTHSDATYNAAKLWKPAHNLKMQLQRPIVGTRNKPPSRALRSLTLCFAAKFYLLWCPNYCIFKLHFVEKSSALVLKKFCFKMWRLLSRYCPNHCFLWKFFRARSAHDASSTKSWSRSMGDNFALNQARPLEEPELPRGSQQRRRSLRTTLRSAKFWLVTIVLRTALSVYAGSVICDGRCQAAARRT